MNHRLDSWFHDTVSALAYSFAATVGESAGPDFQSPYNDLTRFILDQHASMADFLRTPLELATLGFDLPTMLRSGHRFHHLPPALRARQIAAWKNSGSAFKRDLIRYYESLAVFALLSRNGQQPSAVNSAPPADFASRVISQPPAELKAEIVVIGSGPGGAITAALLAGAGRDVLLVEEGDYLSLDSCAPFTKDEMVQKYRNGGQTVALGANKISYVEGRCVGGGSEINSGLYHRTPPEVIETWRKEFQVDGLSDRELEPHFEANERDLSVSSLPGSPPAASVKLRDGAARLGWKSLEVPRWFRYANSADASGGRRQTMSETFIPRLLKAGGRLLPRARALKILPGGDKWTVRARHDAGELRVTAETLFICGGAVQTPALLRRSGLTRNIGNSLRLHPTLKVVARFPDAVNSAQMGVPAHQVKEFAPRFSFGCSVSSPPYLALALLEHPGAAREVPQAWQNLAAYYVMITGEGRGSVRALPKFRDPLVHFNLTEHDRRDLADGLHKLCEALFAGGATALYPGINRGAALSGPDDLAKLPEFLPSGLASLMTIHLFSSCPMGEDPDQCATDSFGRVHGFKNLYVNDASLLCTPPGVNPQGTVMALARRNVKKFLGGN